MSSALYRRYRPESFAEVIGQEHVTDPLSVALDKDRVNHAYLFSGPRGCGKTTSARILARCLNCANGPTSTPCGSCDSCTDLARGGAGSLDVVEIDAASHGGVDDARDLRERAAFAPVRDRYKVFIIDEAHMVSTQGFNALLKIVEEPPEHIRFIFATTEPEKVIGTIRSRTHHYPFRLVPPERLQAYLSELCQREQVPVNGSVLPLVVRAGGGSVRDSLSVLDQLMSGAGDDGLTYPLAVSLLGYTDGALLDDVIDALTAGDGASVFAVVDRVVESGHDPRRFVEDLLERLRDLLVVAATRERAHTVLRSTPQDQLQRMQGQAQRFGAGELSRAADVVNAALTEMTGATSPRLQVELLCARLLLPAADDAERGLRARLDKLERRIGMAVAGAASTPVAQVAQVARADGAAPATPAGPQARAIPRAPEAAAAPTVTATADHAWPEVEAPGAAAGSSIAAPISTPPAPARAPAPPSALPSAPAAAGPAAPGALDVDTIRRMWPEVLATLAGMKRTTWSLVSHYAQVLDFDGVSLVLGFDSTGRAQLFGKGAHQQYLSNALVEVLGLECRFEAVSNDPVSGRPAAQPQPPPRPRADRPAPATPPLGAAAVSESPSPVVAEPARPLVGSADGSAQGTSPGAGQDSAQSQGQPTPYDEIPPPDEPPPDDEPPPEDSGRPETGPRGSGRPETGPRGSGRANPPATPPATPPAAARTIALSDDEVSPDDPVIDGASLVGAAVVEQMLGGRIIEERSE